jgi:hypothetical protein
VPPCADDTLPSVVPFSQSGTTAGAGNDDVPGCNPGSTAPELAFQYVAPAAGVYTINTIGSAYDTMLYVRDGCGGAELACNDDAVGLQSRVNVTLAAGQAIIIYVDGFGSDRGPYDLNISM